MSFWPPSMVFITIIPWHHCFGKYYVFSWQVCIVSSSNFKFNLDWKVQSWSLSHILRLHLTLHELMFGLREIKMAQWAVFLKTVFLWGGWVHHCFMYNNMQSFNHHCKCFQINHDHWLISAFLICILAFGRAFWPKLHKIKTIQNQ